jgi:GNAT superfamily N-acetyltransferase
MAVIEAPDRLQPLIPELAEVYREAFSTLPFPVTDATIRQFRNEILPRHAARADFKLLVAREDDRIIGFIYGYAGASGQYWEDWLAARIPHEVYEEWFGGHFAVTEFCVLPAHHGRGIGSALHDHLLDGLPHERAVLTAHRIDSPARRLYAHKGWQVLCDPVDERHALLGQRLR